MKTLFALILSSVMTWTVQSKSQVAGSGEWPYDIEVAYSCSFRMGDVRAGDTATLTLSNIGGLEIQKVEYYLQSNKSAGAGEMVVIADRQILAHRTGTFADWVGAYDNTAYHSVTAWEGERVLRDGLCLQLIGTTNSLHVEKFVITYRARLVYNVTLMQGSNEYALLSEEYGGAGVLLPALPDYNDMRFVGWCERELWTEQEQPPLYLAGTRYFPTDNTRLWAVWRYSEHTDTAYVHPLHSGDYFFMNIENELVLTGVPAGGKMNNAQFNAADSAQLYRITFNAACDSATIRHLQTGQYIGYEGTKVAAVNTPWLVWHEGCYTAFYTLVGDKTYVLWPNIYGGNGLYAGLLGPTSLEGYRYTVLVELIPAGETYYTSHPESPMGESLLTGEENETVVPFGIYELHVRDGHKSLRLHNE